MPSVKQRFWNLLPVLSPKSLALRALLSMRVLGDAIQSQVCALTQKAGFHEEEPFREDVLCCHRSAGLVVTLLCFETSAIVYSALSAMLKAKTLCWGRCLSVHPCVVGKLSQASFFLS